MKATRLVLAFMAAISLTGCKDTQSPSGVVKTAGAALQKNDAQTFYSVLAGPAAQQFGNAEGMQYLQDRLAVFEKIKISKEKLVSETERSRIYELVISGKADGVTTPIINTGVTCEESEHYQPGYNECTTVILPGGGQSQVCHWVPGKWVTIKDCKITQISVLF